MPTFGSLFSGIGGFDLGLEQAGWECRWQCELDPKARSVLGQHWPKVPCKEDVTQHGSDLDSVDLICGGFPCQDLSVAGQRAGLAGERSGLFYEFARIIGELRPRWVLIENVPGLLSSNDGRDMGAIVGTLAELGYGWSYRVLDAQYFGVAQRRRRVFIVGDSRGTGGAQVLFDSASLSGHPPARREAGARVAGTLEARAATGGYDPGAHGAASGHIVSHALTVPTSNARYDPNGETYALAHALTSAYRSSEDGTGRGVPLVTHSLDLAHGATEDGTGRETPPVAFSVNQRREGRLRDVHASLAAEQSGTQVDGVLDSLAPRRLTPRECERLQGFPDDWTRYDQDGAELADSPRYRMLGNAVAVPVARWIGERLMEAAEL